MATMQNLKDIANKWYVKYIAAPVVAFSIGNAVESDLENKVKDTPAAQYVSGSAFAQEQSIIDMYNWDGVFNKIGEKSPLSTG